MSYTEKISTAKEVISEHNKQAKSAVNVDAFIGKLSDEGGTTEDALRHCAWEDLERCGLPRILARQVASIFRKDSSEVKSKVITEAKAQAMSVAELMSNFDPQCHDTFVGKRLAELSKNQRCLVFNKDGTLNRDASAFLVQEIRDGWKCREVYLVNDCPYQTYKVGENPNQWAYANPLFQSSLLRSDETCDYTNRSWKGITEEVRILLHLAVTKTKELRIDAVDDAHSAIDLILNSTNPVSVIRRRYPKASVSYDEMQKAGTLPTLRLPKSGSGSGSNDPFFGHKRY